MRLIKIYSYPKEIFPCVSFNKGINYVLGKNATGKSTFLRLIDFCLLSPSITKSQNSELKKIFGENTIILEIEIRNKLYKISRSILNPNNAEFGLISGDIEKYKINDLKKIMFNLIYDKKEYKGYSSSNWLRTLLTYNIKLADNYRNVTFNQNPYLSKNQISEYFFFLVGLDNTFTHEMNELQYNQKEIRQLIKNVKSNNFSQDNNAVELQRIKQEINIIEQELFKSIGNNENISVKMSDKINIKNNEIIELWIKNYEDKQTLDYFEEDLSFKEINIDNISKLYNQANELFGGNIRKTLQEAIDLKKRLQSSRKIFIKSEIEDIEQAIIERYIKIKKKENERGNIINSLIQTPSIDEISHKIKKISELQAKYSKQTSEIDYYNELNARKNELNIKAHQLEEKNNENLQEYNKFTNKFNYLLKDSYTQIIQHNDNSPELLIKITKRTIDMQYVFFEKMSEGQNMIMNIVFDLALNNYCQSNNIPTCNFLIYDDFINSLDNITIINLHKYLLKQEKLETQFILTISNDELFYLLKKQKINLEDKIILNLNIDNKLLKRDY